jgi:hypothetical protein
MMMRVNIQYETKLPNVDNDGTGWNLYNKLDSNSLNGKGSNNILAQFYILPEGDYYYFLTFHTHTLKNNLGGFGRYVGVHNDKIMTDMSKCDESLWKLEEI